MHAVEIDGEVYWDGGFSGNPAIFPLVYECESRDVVMVHLTPAERPEVPIASHAIMNRMQEIGFNAALIREMRAVAFVTKLIDQGRLADGKRMLIHVIEAEDVIREFPGSSRLNNESGFSVPSAWRRSCAGRAMAGGEFRSPRQDVDGRSRSEIFLSV